MDGTQFGNMNLVGKVSTAEKPEKKQKEHCPDVNTFAGYLDNKLKSNEREGVEAHMAECGMCRTDFYEVRMLLEENAAPQAPGNLADNVKKNLHDLTGSPAQGRKFKV